MSAVWVLLVEVGYDMPDVTVHRTEEGAWAHLMARIVEQCEGDPDFDALDNDDARFDWAHEHGGFTSTINQQEVLP